VRLLLYAFPRRFRDRYGAEVLEVMRESDTRLRDAADLVLSGVSLRARQALKFMCSRGRARWILLAAVAAAGTPAALAGCAALQAALAWEGCPWVGSAASLTAACAVTGLVRTRRAHASCPVPS
jgi:hypothetical protein